jgi:hypothetical protein
MNPPESQPGLPIDLQTIQVGDFFTDPSREPWLNGNQLVTALASSTESSGDGVLLTIPTTIPYAASVGAVYPLDLSGDAADGNGEEVDVVYRGSTLTVTPGAACGDATGDDPVKIGDVILALQILVALRQATPLQRTALDLDGDGAVELNEVQIILRKVVRPDLVLIGRACVER